MAEEIWLELQNIFSLGIRVERCSVTKSHQTFIASLSVSLAFFGLLRFIHLHLSKHLLLRSKRSPLIFQAKVLLD